MPAPSYKKFGLKLSLNDPRWGRDSQDGNGQSQNQDGRKPNNGPPDLDQLWREFNQRLNRLFGKRGGGRGDSGGGFNPDMRGVGIGAALILAIIVFLWLVSGFFIVQEGQTAVVSTFGKYSHMAPPGFNWRWPYPIQSHDIVNVSELRTVEIGYRASVRNKQLREALMLTDDENIVDVQFAVQYTLKSAADWVFNNRDPEDTVREAAETAIREVVGRSQMDFVLYQGREKISRDVSQLIQHILDRYQSGVLIKTVTMQGAQPPEQVQAAFDDAIKAAQDRERQKSEGQAYANDVIPKARGAASHLLQEAEAYRTRVIATAQGDAARFKRVLAEYQKAPAVTRERMYLDTMQQIFSNTTKLMIEGKGANNLLYLPLDKLISQAAGNEVGSAKPAPAPNQTSPAASGAAPAPDGEQSLESQPPSDARSREGRDSRERETR